MDTGSFKSFRGVATGDITKALLAGGDSEANDVGSETPIHGMINQSRANIKGSILSQDDKLKRKFTNSSDIKRSTFSKAKA